jgi:hypothetical protein
VEDRGDLMSWDIALGAAAALLGSLIGGGFTLWGIKFQISNDREMRTRDERWRITDEILEIATATHGIVAAYSLVGQYEGPNIEMRMQEMVQVYKDNARMTVLGSQLGDEALSKAIAKFLATLLVGYLDVSAIAMNRKLDSFEGKEGADPKDLEFLKNEINKMNNRPDKSEHVDDKLFEWMQEIAIEIARIKGTVLSSP